MSPSSILLHLPLVLMLWNFLSFAGDRVPAVAGQFYPASATELRSTLADLFSRAGRPQGKDPVEALIVPHAGYIFSGQVAASGFVQIDPGRSFDNVFVIGVSHTAAYEGAAVYVEGDFLTPLGPVPVNTEIGRTLLAHRGLFLENSRAHAAEHSLEVQLPFLQYRLKNPFKIVPILLGTSDPAVCARLAQALRPYFMQQNLFVISTDLSHYPSARDAAAIDRKTIDAILSGSAENVLRTVAENERTRTPALATSLCGLGGVLLLQALAATHESEKYALVQYKNSGDVPAGNKNQVVGYAAVAVTGTTPESFQIRPDDQRRLLAIARSTLVEYLQTRRSPQLESKTLSSSLRAPAGAFVTLKKHGELRGCIGSFSGTGELARTVQEMAIAAATGDPRFTPVSIADLSGLEIEISVLSPMRKIASPQEIQLGKHGIYIRKGNRAGTFLPQVAVETGWSLEEFLGHCAQDKAGIGWEGWKDAEVYVYDAIVFSESEHAPKR